MFVVTGLSSGPCAFFFFEHLGGRLCQWAHRLRDRYNSDFSPPSLFLSSKLPRRLAWRMVILVLQSAHDSPSFQTSSLNYRCPHSSRNLFHQALLAMDPSREEAHLLAAQVWRPARHSFQASSAHGYPCLPNLRVTALIEAPSLT